MSNPSVEARELLSSLVVVAFTQQCSFKITRTSSNQVHTSLGQEVGGLKRSGDQLKSILTPATISPRLFSMRDYFVWLLPYVCNYYFEVASELELIIVTVIGVYV